MRAATAGLALVLSAAASSDARRQGEPEDAPEVLIEVGARLPPLAFGELHQSPARVFSELYGRALLLATFDYWSRPCVPAVQVLREVEEALARRGLSVLAVTREAPRKTLPWVERHRASYAFTFDATATLARALGDEEAPLAVLVDGFGEVLWIGPPARLPPAEVERALAGVLATPVWEWPSAARPIAARLQAGEYAAALAAAEALGASGGFDVAALVRARVADELARVEQRLAAGTRFEAYRLARRLERELAGLPESARVAELLAELRAEPVVRRELEAEERLLALEHRRRGLRHPREIRALRDELAAFADEAEFVALATRARALAQALERRLGEGER